MAKHLKITLLYDDSNLKNIIHPNIVNQNTSDTNIIIPTISEMKELLEHVETGYFRGIREELAKLAQLDEKYQPFIQEMGKLAQGFNIQKVRNFLQDSIK
ncbi:hypothetical protein [Brunnivagina elsteri]|uniref:Uncharacterized protein n=1 Tax=Brunnivagina elsteri CCALA 953 TaxID=987040 RepID=A0A2A2TI37_9CYAN|nr:hypothetical protein [Calothrix elsteri]PAX53346.1 hypothetical protein CK510_14455 [Calothrix elsteri CCALA 953]